MSNFSLPKTYSGYNRTFELTEDAVVIKSGIKWFLLWGWAIRWDKTIPYTQITSIQFKKGGLMAGYLQLAIHWESGAKWGIIEASQDENTACFYWNKNSDFLEAKTIIETKIKEVSNKRALAGESNDVVSQIEKLAVLKEKDIITGEEFELKKKQLLGL